MTRRPFAAAMAGVWVCAAAVWGFAGPARQVPKLERFTVQSDGHPMAVWGRRPAAPKAAMLLVHGRTWSSRPDFDLQVPGLHRSVLESLAAHEVAAYAVDLRGYGDTPRDATGWLTPSRAAADITNVLAWVADQHPGLPRPALLGWSRGGADAMLAAQLAPSRVSALVLFGFVFDPNLEFLEPDYPDKPLKIKNTAADAASDFISPKVTPPAVVNAFVAEALHTDPVMMDLKGDNELNILNPERLTVPTLILFGDRDPNVSRSDADKFLARLAASDKQIVPLAGADHAAQLEDTHDAWVAAVVTFMSRSSFAR